MSIRNPINKNSYYLYDTVNALRTKYRYDFANEVELKDIKYLIKLGLAKHHFGGANALESRRVEEARSPARIPRNSWRHA